MPCHSPGVGYSSRSDTAIDNKPCDPYPKRMEVHFSADIETRLQQVASRNGIDAELLVQKTVARMLDDQAQFIAGVQKGVEQAERGELVDHQEVLNRIDRLFKS